MLFPKKLFSGVIFSILFLILPLSSFAQDLTNQDNPDVLLFYGRGCPHCLKAIDFFQEIRAEYPKFVINEYETYFDQDNRILFQEISTAYDSQIQGVPTIFIDDKVIVGFSAAIEDSLRAEIERCSTDQCGSPLSKLDNGDNKDITAIVGDSSPADDPEKTAFKKNLTVPAVLSAAAVDAINPCAFAVLIILLTTILATKNRKRALFAGLFFSLSIYISYFLMGLGLYTAIQAANLTRIFYIVVSILAIFVGLFNLKDYFWYGKWFIMEVPMSWRPRLKALLKGVTSIPGAFLIGFAVSLFLLPCTSGPYIVILGLLASATDRTYAMLLLLLYNFVFILPMLIITFAIYSGFTTTEKAEEWRQKKLKVLHLIAGLIILALGLGMLIALYLGLI